MITNSYNRKFLWFLFLCFLCTNLQAYTIWYVDCSYEEDGGEDISAEEGRSWQRPFTSITESLSKIMYRTGTHEIRIAQGLYSEQVKIHTFANINFRFRGGYAGRGAADPSARDIRLYETVISGDLDRDDMLGHIKNNVPVMSIRFVDNVRLDGLTLADGLIMADVGSVAGSALHIDDGSGHFIVDCTFKNNHGASAVQNRRGVKAHYLRCVFKGNQGRVPAVYNLGSTVLFEDCVFSEHQRAFYYGSGLMKNETTSSPGGSCYTTLKNCQFSSNSVREGPSVLSNFNPKNKNCIVTIENCIFSGNDSGGSSYHYPDLERSQGGAIYNGRSCSVSLQNCLFIGNRDETGGCIINAGDARLNGCIMWDNDTPLFEGENIQVDYSIIQGGYPGVGNLDVDPKFVRPGYWDTNDTPDDLNDDSWIEGDYHLRSQGGHWDVSSNAWVYDDTTSPCIDAGDPDRPVGWEPFPNGGIVNIGAYGGTDEASRSWFDAEPCATVMAGDINGDCKVDEADLALLQSHWLWTYTPPVEPNEPPSGGGGGDGRR